MNSDEIGKKAALLSGIEITVGSFLHSLHIPFAGHLLSLNQGALLSHAQLNLTDRRGAALISTTSAILKSLSPAGKKLTPMLAIGMQGQLFTLGLLLLGNNLFGHILGMVLLCLWGVIQPLIIYLMLYGHTLVSMMSFYSGKIVDFLGIDTKAIWYSVGGLVLLKILMGVGLVILIRYRREKFVQYQDWAMQQKNSVGRKSKAMPFFFLLSLVLMGIFLYHSESDFSKNIWLWLRPVAVACLFWMVMKKFPLQRFIAWLKNRNPQLAESLEAALKYLNS
ncbi:MAG: hypothetical protein JNM93_04845 [Bacteriovoracaceae bacterium]|nr:hypothetical protein [Bacteriovoracaceae bacterium]